MTPDLTNPHIRAYAETFGLADVQADEWPEIEAEMREVAAAPTADRASYLLAGWGYYDRNGDNTAEALTQAAREVRRRLGVVDAPHPEADKERAAVVAWLCRQAERIRCGEYEPANREAALDNAADAITRGDHRKEDR